MPRLFYKSLRLCCVLIYIYAIKKECNFLKRAKEIIKLQKIHIWGLIPLYGIKMNFSRVKLNTKVIIIKKKHNRYSRRRRNLLTSKTYYSFSTTPMGIA